MNTEKINHNHFMNKCKCGAVIIQCRCYSNSKTVNIIQDTCDKCSPVDKRDKNMVLMSRLHKEKNALNYRLHEIDVELEQLEKKMITDGKKLNKDKSMNGSVVKNGNDLL